MKKHTIDKALVLARLAVTGPREFYERVMNFGEVKLEQWLVKPPEYEAKNLDDALDVLDPKISGEIRQLINEKQCQEIVQEVQWRLEQNLDTAPFALAHNADFTLARMCYAACRFLRPETIVETGVAHGVTSAFILKALAVNGAGKLYSIDLPPLSSNANQVVGILVPEELRSRWRLHRGTSKHLLTKILQEVSTVEIFVHDSLHTYRNMKFELETVNAHLMRPGFVIADDVEGNKAFLEWVKKVAPHVWGVVREQQKPSCFGFAWLAT